MEELTAKEKADLARLQAKQKRVDRERKAFFGDVVKNAEQVVDYLIRKSPDVVTSVLQNHGFTVVKNRMEMSGHSDTNFSEASGEKSHGNVQTPEDDFGFIVDDVLDEEPPHF